MPTWNDQYSRQSNRSLRDKAVPKAIPVHLVPKDRIQPSPLTDHQPTDRQTITEADPPAVLKDNRDKAVPKGKAKKPQKPRSWLKIRMPADVDDVLNIVENWRLEKQAAPKVAAAIRLYAALEAEDVDYIRENCPKLITALEKALRKRTTLSLKESDSYIERESAKSEEVEPAVEQIAEAVQTITGRDRHLNRDVYQWAADLHKANYTAQDIERWHTHCWPNDWRAAKAAQECRVERPTLKIIRECIGQVRDLAATQAELPAPNPYLDDPFFARDTDSDLLPPVEEIPAWPPDGCSGGRPVLDPWLATMGQLQIQLNRATYDTWLRHAEPIHFAGDRTSGGTLYVSVPHHYAKDWIDRHLLRALNKTFDDIANYSGEKGERISEQPLFQVAILVEGDPVPGIDCREPLS